MIEDQGTRSERASWSQGAECVCRDEWSESWRDRVLSEREELESD